MAKTVDVEGLSEEQVQLIKDFVKFLRLKTQGMEEGKEEETEEQIAFSTHPSAVKGKLTREEIYDYL